MTQKPPLFKGKTDLLLAHSGAVCYYNDYLLPECKKVP